MLDQWRHYFTPFSEIIFTFSLLHLYRHISTSSLTRIVCNISGGCLQYRKSFPEHSHMNMTSSYLTIYMNTYRYLRVYLHANYGAKCWHANSSISTDSADSWRFDSKRICYSDKTASGVLPRSTCYVIFRSVRVSHIPADGWYLFFLIGTSHLMVIALDKVVLRISTSQGISHTTNPRPFIHGEGSRRRLHPDRLQYVLV